MECSMISSTCPGNSNGNQRISSHKCDLPHTIEDVSRQTIHHCRSISITSFESLSHDEDEDASMTMACNPLVPRNPMEVAGNVEDEIEAMRCQESRWYLCPDYLKQKKMEKQDKDKQFNCLFRRDHGTYGTKNNRMIDELCREQICEWSFRVVDYFNVSREVVAISISYLDRFVSKCTCDRKTFKLAATTCLYIACKIHESVCNFDFLGILTKLSRGEFKEQNITKMEKVLLRSLGWMVHPPIPSWYVSHYLELSPFKHLCPDVMRDLLDHATFLTELAVMDYFFVSKRASLIGLAAVLEATETMAFDALPMDSRHAFEVVIARVIPDLNTMDLVEIRLKLRVIYKCSQEAIPDQLSCVDTRTSGRGKADETALENAVSPVSVLRQEINGM